MEVHCHCDIKDVNNVVWLLEILKNSNINLENDCSNNNNMIILEYLRMLKICCRERENALTASRNDVKNMMKRFFFHNAVDDNDDTSMMTLEAARVMNNVIVLVEEEKIKFVNDSEWMERLQKMFFISFQFGFQINQAHHHHDDSNDSVGYDNLSIISNRRHDTKVQREFLYITILLLAAVTTTVDGRTQMECVISKIVDLFNSFFDESNFSDFSKDEEANNNNGTLRKSILYALINLSTDNQKNVSLVIEEGVILQKLLNFILIMMRETKKSQDKVDQPQRASTPLEYFSTELNLSLSLTVLANLTANGSDTRDILARFYLTEICNFVELMMINFDQSLNQIAQKQLLLVISSLSLHYSLQIHIKSCISPLLLILSRNSIQQPHECERIVIAALANLAGDNFENCKEIINANGLNILCQKLLPRNCDVIPNIVFVMNIIARNYFKPMSGETANKINLIKFTPKRQIILRLLTILSADGNDPWLVLTKTHMLEFFECFFTEAENYIKSCSNDAENDIVIITQSIFEIFCQLLSPYEMIFTSTSQKMSVINYISELIFKYPCLWNFLRKSSSASLAPLLIHLSFIYERTSREITELSSPSSNHQSFANINSTATSLSIQSSIPMTAKKERKKSKIQSLKQAIEKIELIIQNIVSDCHFRHPVLHQSPSLLRRMIVYVSENIFNGNTNDTNSNSNSTAESDSSSDQANNNNSLCIISADPLECNRILLSSSKSNHRSIHIVGVKETEIWISSLLVLQHQNVKSLQLISSLH